MVESSSISMRVVLAWLVMGGIILVTSSALAASGAESPTVLAAQSAGEGEDDDIDAPVGDGRHRAPVLRRPIYDAAAITIGVDGAFSLTRSNVELVDDDETEATDSTRFLRLDPSVTIGIIDRLHVGLLAGLVQRRLAREGAESATDTALAFQPVTRFFMPVSRTLAFYAQGAPGYFRGSSERPLTLDKNGGDAEAHDTRTRGFILTLGTGINYRVSDGLQLRFGLSLDGMWGRESLDVDGFDDSLSTSTVHLGTRGGLHYTF